MVRMSVSISIQAFTPARNMSYVYWHSDVRGVIYLKDIDVLQTGTMARWTLDWVAFYHGEWDVNNFTAVVRIFPPAFSVLKSDCMT